MLLTVGTKAVGPGRSRLVSSGGIRQRGPGNSIALGSLCVSPYHAV